MVMNGGWFMTLLYPHCNIYQTLIGHSWWKERCICLLLWCHLMFILSGYLSLKVLTHSHILAWAEFRHVSVLNFEPLAPWIPWSTQSSTGLSTNSQLVFCRRPTVFGTCYGFRRTTRWFGNRRPEKLSAVFDWWQLIAYLRRVVPTDSLLLCP